MGDDVEIELGNITGLFIDESIYDHKLIEAAERILPAEITTKNLNRCVSMLCQIAEKAPFSGPERKEFVMNYIIGRVKNSPSNLNNLGDDYIPELISDIIETIIITSRTPLEINRPRRRRRCGLFRCFIKCRK